MEIIHFHLYCHFWLHFDHRVEQLLKKLKIFAFYPKRHWCGLNWSDGHRLGIILQIDQDVGQSVQRVLWSFRYLVRSEIRPVGMSEICCWVSVAPVTM